MKVEQRSALVGAIPRPLALAFVDRCLRMRPVRIGAAIAFDVVSTLNADDERLRALEASRQQQYAHIYNKTQSTKTTNQQTTKQPKATAFNNIRIIIPSTTTTTTTTSTGAAGAAAASTSKTDDKLATVNYCMHFFFQQNILIYNDFCVKFEKLVVTIEGLPIGKQCPPNAAHYLALDTRDFVGTTARRLVARSTFTDIVYERVDNGMYRSTIPIFRSGDYSIFEM